MAVRMLERSRDAQGRAPRRGRILPTLALLLAATLLAAAVPARADNIRFSVTDAWGQPFGEFAGEEFKSGLMKDLLVAIAAELGLDPVYVKLPRKRVDQAVQDGQIDARCYISPQWVTTPDAYVWSGPLFEIHEMVVRRADAPRLDAIDDLKGRTLGLVGGFRGGIYDSYRHTNLIGALETTSAPSIDNLLNMLVQRRINYASVNSLAFAYYRKRPEYAAVLAPDGLVTETSIVQCAFPRNGKVPTARLLEATTRMRARGDIDRIIAKYR
jgi:polar amino acid transport system substrate-binding protein